MTVPWWIEAGLAAIAVLALAGSLWWWIPKFQMRSIVLGDPKARADIEDNFRKTVGQALGGVAVLMGAGVAYLQFQQQQQAARDLLVSNQAAKGFEQLASPVIIMRLGGIYALQGVMNTSVDYYEPVLAALCAYVRESTRGMIVNEKPAEDIQAALTVIGTRPSTRVAKSNAHSALDTLLAIDQKAFTKFSWRSRINLRLARIPGAILTDADLSRADLSEAILTDADLSEANLSRASLTGTNLSGAFLQGANLSGVSAQDANLSRANLTHANLFYAVMTGVDLSHAILNDADLSDIEMSGAIVTQAQLEKACGKNAKLPLGLTLKPCPYPKTPR